MYKLFNYKNIDLEKSKYLATKFDISPRRCYENIFNIILSEIESQSTDFENDIQIAYGYYGEISTCMTRHCFIISNGKIIDPTSYELAVKQKFDYQIFKEYSLSEYITTVIQYYKIYNPKVEIAPWFEYFIKEERGYCRYLIENQIPIDRFSYEKFLKNYDELRQANIN